MTWSCVRGVLRPWTGEKEVSGVLHLSSVICRRAAGRLLPVLLLASLALAADPDYRSQGHDHYFNLEYDEAIADYRQLLKSDPNYPATYNYLATAILYKELHRLGMLESSAFRGDNKFLKQEKRQPDPGVRRNFRDVLFKGREIAESGLETGSDDAMLLYALSNSFALEGNYDFMIDRSYFAALRHANRANSFSKKLRKKHPDFVDAYLIAGVHQYVLGSLPFPVRILIAFGGMRGDKKKGEAWVAKVAQEGKIARHEARTLLALLLRREKRPLEAAEILSSLMDDFPRNYVIQLELGAMYLDAGKKEQALATFRDVEKKYNEKAPGFERLAGRALGALQRKIETLEAELKQAAFRQLGSS